MDTEVKKVDSPYKSFDIFKGAFEMAPIPGSDKQKKEFVKQGKAKRVGVRMTDDEVKEFNHARSGIDCGTVTEQVFPSIKK